MSCLWQAATSCPDLTRPYPIRPDSTRRTSAHKYGEPPLVCPGQSSMTRRSPAARSRQAIGQPHASTAKTRKTRPHDPGLHTRKRERKAQQQRPGVSIPLHSSGGLPLSAPYLSISPSLPFPTYLPLVVNLVSSCGSLLSRPVPAAACTASRLRSSRPACWQEMSALSRAALKPAVPPPEGTAVSAASDRPRHTARRSAVRGCSPPKPSIRVLTWCR